MTPQMYNENCKYANNLQYKFLLPLIYDIFFEILPLIYDKILYFCP